MTQTETGGDASSDSERIRILGSCSSLHNRGDTSRPRELQQNENTQFASGDESSIGIDRRKIHSDKDESYKHDCTFHNMGFTLSPSDLERWRFSSSAGMSGRSSSGRSLRRTKSDCKISIHRNPVDNTYIDKKCGPLPPEKPYKKAARYLKSQCSCSWMCFVSLFTSLFPILAWLPKYKREFLLPDIIAGFTVSILHIPQGMAYGVLAAVRAENGLYVSFFPVLIYILLGTSRHISIGSFAVISLMLSNAVYGSGAVDKESNSTSNNFSLIQHADEPVPPTHLETVTTLAVAVGFWQLMMGVFRLGSLSVVLSDQLISGFSTGAACHVAMSQMKDLLGISIGRHGGALQLIYALKDMFENLVHTNLITLMVSAIAIFVLAVFKEQIDGRLKGKLRMPIPIDLIVVVVATLVSYYTNLHTKHDVSIIKDIPTGLPAPVAPRLDILPPLLVNSFAIAIVAFAISLSMAKLLSKNKYTIRPNQELLALGCANIFSSFFACYPCSASLSRSLVQERAGGRTQIAGLVSCAILLVVLLALAPMFYSLPKCILACIILVALKPMFMQVQDFFRAWGISKLDAFIWLVTFLATVLLDVTYGLLIGVVFSLLSVIVRTVIPAKTFLGRIPDTDIYLDANRYDMAHEISGVKVFHFESALYFINRELFKYSLYKYIPPKIEDPDTKNMETRIHKIVIDCSTFTFVDISGLETLLEIMKVYQDVGISVFLSGCSISMQDVMARAKFQEKAPLPHCVFPTIHDAVEFHYHPHSSLSRS